MTKKQRDLYSQYHDLTVQLDKAKRLHKARKPIERARYRVVGQMLAAESKKRLPLFRDAA